MKPDELPIQIWLSRIGPPDETTTEELKLLSCEERGRASKFHFSEHRNTFVRSRAMLRKLVGNAIGIPPWAVSFCYGSKGKPIIASDPSLHVNVAHSAGLFACAITRLGPIGIDVEEVAPRPDLETIAETFFAPEEQAQLRCANDPWEAFYRCWTRKEAFVKATGDGLSMDLRSFAVSISEDRLIRLPCLEAFSTWTLRSFQPTSGFVGAWAIRASNATATVQLLEDLARQLPP